MLLRTPLLLLLLAPGSALRGDEGQKKVVASASPSIVRVHVSRSSAYAKAPYWSQPTKQGWPGQLGGFDAAAARKRVPADAPNRARLLASIRAHDLSDPKLIPESYGSGIVVDRAGLVLTNAHVVRNATKVYVRLPEKGGAWADVYASDPRSDFAILKLIDPPAGLKALPMGDGDRLRQADPVYCLANQLAPGFRADAGPTFWSGTISKVRQRRVEQTSEVERAKYPLQYFGSLVQTSEQIAPACSGGALLDAQGRAVGLTCVIAGVRGDELGTFALPLDTNAKRIIAALKKGEEVEYGFLGVMLEREERQMVQGGASLFRISPGSPAAAAGLMSGDRIVRIDGKEVRNNADLFLYIGMALAGNTARVVVSRGAGERAFNVSLAKFPVPGSVIAAKQPPARFGLRVDWTSVLQARNAFPFSMRAPAQGVVIREVVPNTAADKARLQPDKIITKVNGAAVVTPADYYREVGKAGKSVTLTYLNSNGRSQEITLEEK